MKHIALSTLLAASLAVPAVASAQDGATMQIQGPQANPNLRYNNPSNSRQVLEAPASTSNGSNAGSESGQSMSATDRIRARYAPEGSEGGELGDPLANNRIAGISRGRGEQPVLYQGNEIYRGVIPSERDTLPHLTRHQARAESGGQNTLTWIGFQPFDDYTRIFVQTGRSPNGTYRVSESPDGMTITIEFSSTRISLSNFYRTIEAAYFGRSVSRMYAERASNGGARVVIELFEPVQYAVSSSNNSDYVFVDFRDRD